MLLEKAETHWCNSRGNIWAGLKSEVSFNDISQKFLVYTDKAEAFMLTRSCYVNLNVDRNIY